MCSALKVKKDISLPTWAAKSGGGTIWGFRGKSCYGSAYERFENEHLTFYKFEKQTKFSSKTKTKSIKISIIYIKSTDILYKYKNISKINQVGRFKTLSKMFILSLLRP